MRGRDAFWITKYGRAGSRGVAMYAAGQVPPMPQEAPTEPIHMPAPSFFPLVIAAGLFVMGLGWIVLWYRLVALGALAMFLGVVGMAFEYPTFGQETHETEEASRSAGTDVRKVGLWSFIGSECLFFATLISTYVVYKARNPAPPGAEILEIPLTSFSTFILLMSSVLMVLALNAIQRDDKLWNRIWLIGCAFFGMIFLGVEIHEFHGFWLKGMAYQTNLFSQCFYTLVGTHGTHVAIGILWILRSDRGVVHRQARQIARAVGRAGGTLLALRGHRMGHHLHAGLSDAAG